MRWTCGNGGLNSFRTVAPKPRGPAGFSNPAVRLSVSGRRQKRCVCSETKLGTLAQARPPKTPGARQKTPRRHAQRAATSVWRQPSRGLGGAGSTGLHSKKKLIKYRERNEAQRWLFRRELEKLARRPVFYLDECGVDHRLYREYGRAPRGERIYQAVAGKRRERTSIISA